MLNESLSIYHLQQHSHHLVTENVMYKCKRAQNGHAAIQKEISVV